MGGWRSVERGHLSLQQVFCDTCGQMIPRLAWHEPVAGHEMRFCGQRCAALMASYYLPRYGLPRRFRPGPLASRNAAGSIDGGDAAATGSGQHGGQGD
jgi:hypothetical protein